MLDQIVAGMLWYGGKGSSVGFKHRELLDIKLLFSWDQSCYWVLQLDINGKKKNFKKKWFKESLKLFIRDTVFSFSHFSYFLPAHANEPLLTSSSLQSHSS